jgi:hypothetical protein
MHRAPSHCLAVDWRNARRSGPVTDSIGATRNHNSNYVWSYRRAAGLACSNVRDHYRPRIHLVGVLRPRDAKCACTTPSTRFLGKYLVRSVRTATDSPGAWVALDWCKAALAENNWIDSDRDRALHLPLLDLGFDEQARHSPLSLSDVSDLTGRQACCDVNHGEGGPMLSAIPEANVRYGPYGRLRKLEGRTGIHLADLSRLKRGDSAATLFQKMLFIRAIRGQVRLSRTTWLG